MADRWKIVTMSMAAHDGEPCPIGALWPLIHAAGAWADDPSPANADRLAAIVGAMQTLGIMVPAGEGEDDGE